MATLQATQHQREQSEKAARELHTMALMDVHDLHKNVTHQHEQNQVAMSKTHRDLQRQVMQLTKVVAQLTKKNKEPA